MTQAISVFEYSLAVLVLTQELVSTILVSEKKSAWKFIFEKYTAAWISKFNVTSFQK